MNFISKASVAMLRKADRLEERINAIDGRIMVLKENSKKYFEAAHPSQRLDYVFPADGPRNLQTHDLQQKIAAELYEAIAAEEPLDYCHRGLKLRLHDNDDCGYFEFFE
jgi:hypothetical protein